MDPLVKGIFIGILVVVAICFVSFSSRLVSRFNQSSLPPHVPHLNALSTDAKETIPLAERFNYDSIKTGDMYLAHDGTSNVIKLALFGSPYTHVGIFHRCSVSGRLFLLENGAGIQYELIDKKRKTYPGSLYVRRLKQPLEATATTYLQQFIDTLYEGRNLRPDITNICTYPKDSKMMPWFRLNFDSSKPVIEQGPDAASVERVMLTNLWRRKILHLPATGTELGGLCTDLTFILYQRMGVIPMEIKEVCLEPLWFVTAPELDEKFEEVRMISDQDKDVERFAVNGAVDEEQREVAINNWMW